MAFLVGVSLTVAVLALSGQLNLSDTAKAETSEKVAGKPYTPTFQEWVSVYLKTQVDSHDSYYSISTLAENTDRGYRWKVFVNLYSKRPEHKKMLMNILKSRKEYLLHLVKFWKKQGYDIKMSDFIFTEQQVED